MYPPLLIIDGGSYSQDKESKFTNAGKKDDHWHIVQSIVMEVHDIKGRALKVEKLLQKKGFKHVTKDKEKALEETDLINIYATR